MGDGERENSELKHWMSGLPEEIKPVGKMSGLGESLHMFIINPSITSLQEKEPSRATI